MRSEELKEALGQLVGRKARPAPLVLTPGCPFGAVVESRLGELEREFGDIKGRLNSLFFLVIGAVMVEVVLRVLR
ncbi:MAG: hypothetical protein AAB037_07230 [Chloroflexota bacterium]